MPGLIACNRRWDIASDDLMFPAFFESCIRLLWLIGIAVVFNTHKLSFDCSHGIVVQSYYIGMLVILSSHLVLSIAIVIVSMRGTITKSRPRRNMPALLYIKLTLFIPELVWTILGTYWAFDVSSNCESFVVTAVKITAIAGWFLLVSLIVAILIVFDPLGSLHSAEDSSSAAIKLWETRCKLLCCCAGCDDQNADAFGDTARLLADLFKDVDAVPTDIAAGLILVQEQQKQQPLQFTLQPLQLPPGLGGDRDACSPHPLPSSNHPPTGQSVIETQPKSGEAIDELLVNLEGAPTSEGAATGDVNLLGLGESEGLANGEEPQQRPGKTNQAFENKLQVCPEGQHLSCDHTQVKQREAGESEAACDICDGINTGVLEEGGAAGRGGGVSPRDWMSVKNAAHFMQFSLGTYSWPVYMYMNLCCGACKLCTHCSCCNRQTTSSHVVDDNCCACHTAALLKITGVQQMDVIYASFNNKIYETPFYVALDHDTRSVVIAVRGTMSLRDALTDMTAGTDGCCIEGLGEQCVHKGILQAAKYIENTLNNMDLLNTAFNRCPDYNLVVTGHSLGAGAATLLAILLRPKYRDVRCFGFSPPGWLLSLQLSKYTESFVCSVVIGDDLIPRLGVRTLERLKMSILKEMRDCELPKYKILAGGCWRAVCGRKKPRRDVESQGSLLHGNRHNSYTDETTPTQSEQNRSKSYQEQLTEAIQQSDRASHNTEDLYMPGTVLYLMEEEPTSDCFETPVYRPVWAKPEHFEQICVNPKMLRDHLPDVVLNALKETAEEGTEARQVLLELRNVQTAR